MSELQRVCTIAYLLLGLQQQVDSLLYVVDCLVEVTPLLELRKLFAEVVHGRRPGVEGEI